MKTENAADCCKTQHTTKDYSGLTNGIIAFVVLVALTSITAQVYGFLTTHWLWIAYLDLAVASLAAAIWYLASYRATIGCMHGMMIGMTIGMQTGMMIGAVIGATNGFFTGAMTGMLLGVLAGTLAGKCCGVMGIMEGMMAGVMGGTMGAMITVMMLTDRIFWFMPFYMSINIIILAGLSSMFLKEVVDKETKKKSLDTFTFVSICVIVTAILIAITLWGPKSALVGG